VVSENVQAKRCAAGSARCVTAQGEGGVASAAHCRAGACAERGWMRRRCTGTQCPLWTRWAASFVPHWHGRDVKHASSRAGVAWGIGRGCTEGLDGEVTGREVVGGALPRSGALGDHGDGPGWRGVAG
jgi:hypothetical protein